MKSHAPTTSKTVTMEPVDAKHALTDSQQTYIINPTSRTKRSTVTMKIHTTKAPLVSRLSFVIKGASDVTYTLHNNPSTIVKTADKTFSDPSISNLVDASFIPALDSEYITLSFIAASLETPIEISKFFAAGCFDSGD